MGFGDLKTDCGLGALNEYLESRSYVDGYVITSGVFRIALNLNNARSCETAQI